MRSTGYAIGWQLWRRHRGVMVALLAYGAALTIVAHILPLATAQKVCLGAALPFVFGVLYLMGVFAHLEADVGSPHSGYPAHTWTLPARTGELVLWPMLYGSATLALSWIACARLLLHPLGVPAPIGWPAALFAAVVACLQALVWCPVGLPYLRILIGLVAIPVLISSGVNAAVSGVSPAVLTAAYLGVIGGAGVVATAGLARARRGDSPEWPWLPPRSEGLPRARWRPGRFGSPAPAQLWFEWRSSGFMLPLVIAVIGLLASVPMFWFQEMTPLVASAAGSSLDGVEVLLGVKLQGGCLFWPPLFAALVGCGRRRFEGRKKEWRLSPFLSTRPMSDVDLVLARCRMAAGSTLAAWAVLLLFAFVWLLLPARDGGTPRPLLGILLEHATPRMLVAALFALLALMLWTWKNQVQGLCADLTGRAWIVYGAPLAAHTLAFVAVVVVANWSGDPPAAVSRAYPALGLVLCVMGLAAAAKGGAATWALCALWQRRLVGTRALLGMLAVWSVVALGLFGALSWAVAQGFLSGLPIPPEFLGARHVGLAVVLFVPIARLAAAPLALEWNRHR